MNLSRTQVLLEVTIESAGIIEDLSKLPTVHVPVPNAAIMLLGICSDPISFETVPVVLLMVRETFSHVYHICKLFLFLNKT